MSLASAKLIRVLTREKKRVTPIQIQERTFGIVQPGQSEGIMT